MNYKKQIILAIALISLSACASKSYLEGDVRSSYSPEHIGNVDASRAATIKAAEGLVIWKVDGERKVNAFKLMVGQGLDSILVSEGFHTLSASRGMDLNIGRTNFEAGHEYLIDYIEEKEGDRRRVYYWVVDLADNKVVAGQERKLSEFQK
jgi:hypothetical protein